MNSKETQTRKTYVVLKPQKILDREFERLSSSSDFIKEILKSSLDSLPDISLTRASCPGRAMSNFFFRGVDNNLYNLVTAKSFNKMFSLDVDNYAFEIPAYDTQDLNGVSLTNYQARMMRAADLAKEIAERRNENQGKYRDFSIRFLEEAFS